jgi:hypothetical protein
MHDPVIGTTDRMGRVLMSEINQQDGIRELTLAELDEIAGGVTINGVDISARNLGIGQLNVDSVALGNINIGVGKLNVFV